MKRFKFNISAAFLGCLILLLSYSFSTQGKNRQRKAQEQKRKKSQAVEENNLPPIESAESTKDDQLGIAMVGGIITRSSRKLTSLNKLETLKVYSFLKLKVN